MSERASTGTRQLLFYEQATPVTPALHGDWSVELGKDYAFASVTNSVPLTRVEFARACRDYPIVFAGEEDDCFPLAVLGVADRQNLFVNDRGQWTADYVPAFVRRYPFVFTSLDGGANFTLCIDQAFAGCNTEGRGERLFDEHGRSTRYLDNVLAFLKEYQLEHQRTRDFARRLQALSLLEPVQANIAVDSAKTFSLTDFKVVSRQRLKQVGAVALTEMFGSDDLELAYLHLQSLQAFGNLLERVKRGAT